MNSTDRPAAEPERLTVRSPDDVVAAVPVVLGFEPCESLVVMTFGGLETFHARVDLPDPGHPDHLAALVEQVVAPARTHRVESVVLVVYSSDQDRAEAVVLGTTAGFVEAGITVMATVRADGARWWSTDWPASQSASQSASRSGSRSASRPASRRPSEGTPYDAAAHRFRAQAVLRGHVVHRSRAELAELLDPVPSGVAAVRAARRRGRTVDAASVTELVARGVAAGRLGDDDLVVLLLSLRRPASRDAAWTHLERSNAEAHVQFWTDAVQRSPADLVVDAAAVLALVAWLSGHGALAWCAIDRCRRFQPHHSLAGLVDDLLSAAVPPTQWQRLRPGGIDRELVPRERS